MFLWLIWIPWTFKRRDTGAKYFLKGSRKSNQSSKHLSQKVVMKVRFFTLLIEHRNVNSSSISYNLLYILAQTLLGGGGTEWGGCVPHLDSLLVCDYVTLASTTYCSYNEILDKYNNPYYAKLIEYIFSHFKFCLATATRNFKWLKITPIW